MLTAKLLEDTVQMEGKERQVGVPGAVVKCERVHEVRDCIVIHGVGSEGEMSGINDPE